MIMKKFIILALLFVAIILICSCNYNEMKIEVFGIGTVSVKNKIISSYNLIKDTDYANMFNLFKNNKSKDQPPIPQTCKINFISQLDNRVIENQLDIYEDNNKLCTIHINEDNPSVLSQDILLQKGKHKLYLTAKVKYTDFVFKDEKSAQIRNSHEFNVSSDAHFAVNVFLPFASDKPELACYIDK